MDVLEAKVQRGPELLDRGLGPEHAAGQGEDLLGILRQAVSLAVFVDLQEMLHPAEEDIVFREPPETSAGRMPASSRAERPSRLLARRSPGAEWAWMSCRP